MRLDWAIPCMRCGIENGVIVKIENAAWDILWVPEFPASLEFIVLIRLLGQPDEFAEGGHTMEAILTGPGMEGVAQVEFEVPTGEPDPIHPEGWEVNAVIPVLVQFTANAEGTYVVDLYVDGRYQQGRSIPFRVLVRQPG